MTTYKELMNLISECQGTCHIWKRYPYADLVYTDGIKLFCDKAKANWFIDVVGSYIPKLKKIDDYFFKIVLRSKGGKCMFKITQEQNETEKSVVIQRIPYTDLVEGKYSFFLIRDYEKYTLMVPEEY